MSPIYGYECEDCKVSFESLETLKNRDLPTVCECPKCGEYGVRRIMGASRWLLKGPDWARDGQAMRKTTWD